MKMLKSHRAGIARATVAAVVGMAAALNVLGQGASAVYDVEHTVAVRDLPAGAKTVKVWFWMPENDANQTTRSFTIDEAPEGYLIVREPTTGSRFLYAEAPVKEGEAVSFATRFTVERREVSASIEPSKVGPITREHRAMYAEHLATDTPHMQVTAQVRTMADQIVGSETNPYLQAKAIYHYVVDNSEHYSKGGGAPKSSGLGSAEYCINLGGGGCTDQHSLFIALARAKGIPTRIVFGSRLNMANEGKAYDPGYRCWVEYFVPNHGWVSMDAAAGDTVAGKKDFYQTGLDNARIRWAWGRNYDLGTGHRLNTLIGAYVEVDGKAHEGWDRRVTFKVAAPAQTENTNKQAGSDSAS